MQRAPVDSIRLNSGRQAPQALFLALDRLRETVGIGSDQRVALALQPMQQLSERIEMVERRRNRCRRRRGKMGFQALRPARSAALASSLSAITPALT